MGHTPYISLAAIAALLAFFLATRVKTNALHPTRLAVSASLLVVLIAGGLGCNSGGLSSAIQQQPQVAATPAIAPNGGTFSTSYPTVTITDSTPGASIHYTIDGSMPTSSSSTYSAAINLNSAATVQAMATASGYTASSVASAAFKLQTASGSYTLIITPTAMATGSSKQLAMNPIPLTLTVK